MKKEGAVTSPEEYGVMAADLEDGLAWSREQWLTAEFAAQKAAMEEFEARRRGRDVDGIIILDDSGDEAPPAKKPFRRGDEGEGCSRAPKDEPPSDGEDGGGDYDEAIYRSLGMD